MAFGHAIGQGADPQALRARPRPLVEGAFTAAAAIRLAQEAGVNVRVVNDSATWVGTAPSQALSAEIDLLGEHNILFVTAAPCR